MDPLDSFTPIKFGRYVLVERVATGGMAEIFRAKIQGAHGFEKTLVVKRILPQLAAGDQFVDMFIDEAKVMVRLNHPKIVSVHDFGEVDGQYYIAMEFVDGLDGLALLRKCAQRRCRPTTGIAVHIIAEVLDALDYAHNLTDEEENPLGIVHRDISPSNIFISALGEVKLGDFGIAQGAFSKEQSDTGTLKGKYGYMAPEQVNGESVDKRSDVFSVGVVLAELLMIRRLFVAKSDLEVLLKVRDAQLDRLDKYGRHIPRDLRRILESALARDPAMRYQDAATFRDALHRYLFDNRRMVRSADVRRFLVRLTEEPVAKATQDKWEGRTPDIANIMERELVTVLAKRIPQERRRKPSGTEYSQIVRNEVDNAGAISLRGLVNNTSGVINSADPQKEPKSFFNDETPASLKNLEGSGGAFPTDPSTVGQKRRILLSPPPNPLPVPIGLPQTGEMPRLTSSDTLAEVSDLGLGDSSPNVDFFESHPIISTTDELETSDSEEPEKFGLEPTAVIIDDEPPDFEGDLSEKSFFRLLFDLAMEEETGLLIIKTGDAVKEIYLVNGDPRFVTSNQANELFGQYLVNKGVLATGELSMALAMLPHFEGKLGDALVALKLLGPMEVLRHLTYQVRQKLLDSFSLDEGRYFFFRGRQPVNESAPLGLDAFELMGSAAMAMSSETLERRIKSIMDKRLKAVIPPQLPPEIFRLGDEPRYVHDRLVGLLSLAEILEKFDDREQRDSFARIVYLLVETGLVSV